MSNISVHISFLLPLVIFMCFNNSTFASRASFNTLVSDQLPGRISIENNLANNLEALELDILNESPKYTLKVGDPLILSSSNVVRQAEVTWSREQPLFATFELDVPNAGQTIYWSVRSDGVYRSLDNIIFAKVSSWIERK
ncbi:hypothetical protein P8452_11119 [Trifolium repens]|nr:hypothetical protein P8452_11119 [Trifolium repens]